MKTLKTLIALVVLVITFSSCRKNEDQIFSKENSEEQTTYNCIYPQLPVLPPLMCAPKSVPLCVPQGSVGTISIATGVDNKVYVTFTTNPQWFIRECNLFVGNQQALPVTSAGTPIPELFNYTQTFTNYTLSQNYTFVVNNPPQSMVMAAYCTVANVTNGQLMALEGAWGDGCNGANNGTYTIQ